MPDVVVTGAASSSELDWALSRLPAGYRPIVVLSGDRSLAEVARRHGATMVDSGSPHDGVMSATSVVVCLIKLGESVDPRDLGALVDPVADGTADMTLASRQWSTASLLRRTWWSSVILKWSLRRASGVPLTDVGPMRAARRDSLRSLGVQGEGDAWWLEMVLRCQRAGWRLTEVPVRCAWNRRWARSLSGTALCRAPLHIDEMRARIDQPRSDSTSGQ